MDDLTGREFGPYQIVAPLGEGGMAAVYKAYQPGMDRHVAIKILHRHIAENPQFVRRFHQEAKVIASLQHAHVLPVHDFGEQDGYLYLVMPYVSSGTLADRLTGQPLPLDQARRLISQLADALDCAHEQGLIHRDLKPNNVLLDVRGNCLLANFGIAKIVEGTEHLTTTGGILGTPTYMSPEQALGTAIDARSDVYALGVILFEMVTGRVPFQAATPVAVVVKHINDPLPLPRTIIQDLPEAIEQVITKALSKEPKHRYATAGQLARAFTAGQDTVETGADVATVLMPAAARTGRADAARRVSRRASSETEQETIMPSGPERDVASRPFLGRIRVPAFVLQWASALRESVGRLPLHLPAGTPRWAPAAAAALLVLAVIALVMSGADTQPDPGQGAASVDATEAMPAPAVMATDADRRPPAEVEPGDAAPGAVATGDTGPEDAAEDDGQTAMIAQIQAGLARLRYDVGVADGVAGERTGAAIRRFQQRYNESRPAGSGIPVDGTPSAALLPLIETAEPLPPLSALLISVDTPSTVSVDGNPVGMIQPGSPQRISVEQGEHLLIATAEDGDTYVQALVEVGGSQAVVMLELAAEIAERREESAAERARAVEAERSSGELLASYDNVSHAHRFGGCTGTLTFRRGRVEFRADKDSFTFLGDDLAIAEVRERDGAFVSRGIHFRLRSGQDYNFSTNQLDPAAARALLNQAFVGWPWYQP